MDNNIQMAIAPVTLLKVSHPEIRINRTYAKQPYLVGANGRSPLQMVYNWVCCI